MNAGSIIEKGQLLEENNTVDGGGVIAEIGIF